MYELIVTEKPNAAKKIAEALADGKPVKKNINGIPYYELSHKKKDIVVTCAVGHLYGLDQKSGKKSDFPVFDIEWKPVSELSKSSAYTKKYLSAIEKLAKNASSFTVATDYDIEGEVIGLNVIRFACKQKDANRMKFSTLTKEDLTDAYEKASKHLDWGQANAGVARHKLDWFYGINTSRALTQSILKAGFFKLLSSGRVQGPALKLIVEKEKEIQAFRPTPYWQISLTGSAKDSLITAWHEKDKFWNKDEAAKIFAKIKNATSAIIASIEKRQFQQAAPHPFDLTTLQMESHRCFGISPKQTLETAQELYIAGLISYPRTSSQMLPKEIGYSKIVSKLAKQSEFADGAKILLGKKYLNPNNGEKTDPAHPAIYPTGQHPVGIEKNSHRIYDLIVRRFLATFGDPALRETVSVKIDCKEEVFLVKGTTTVELGWYKLYGKYVPSKEEELPKPKEKESIKVKEIKMHDKETQAPPRFTEASIIKELEKRNLGTKSTRANIIDTLFQRGYVDGKPIKATKLGIKTNDILEKYSPKLIDEALTRHFEEEMDDIYEGKETEAKVLDEAKKAISDVVSDFKKHGKEIGEGLKEANLETRDEMSVVGKCPVCGKGDLTIRKGKFGVFVSCNKYPECKTIFSLPRGALIKPAKKECPECGFPMVLSIRKGKKPQEVCFNPECPSKKETKKQQIEMMQLEEEKRACPKCGKGVMVIKRSAYGAFLACNQYPKCRYTESIQK
jgi:DNA topoisomerase-1